MGRNLKRFAVLLVVLSLGGCRQPAPERGEAPQAPFPHQSGADDMRSGMDGGGGGGM